MLSERERNIAISAFCNTRGSRDSSIVAAVEAVLANARWDAMKQRPGCVECGATITSSDPTATTCHAHAKEQPPVQPAGDVDDYVAWLCWRGNDSHRHLVLCDSDADGAFKIYRKPKGNREFIGTLRARLMAPFDCPWNGLVRDITAADETSGELCDPTAVMQALIASICERAYLDHSFPERQHSGLLGLFAQADKPRTRVEIVKDEDTNDCYDVYLDGRMQHTFCGKEHAERYAAGLRAEING
jgi:hypothetical protein